MVELKGIWKQESKKNTSFPQNDAQNIEEQPIETTIEGVGTSTSIE